MGKKREKIKCKQQSKAAASHPQRERSDVVWRPQKGRCAVMYVVIMQATGRPGLKYLVNLALECTRTRGLLLHQKKKNVSLM